MEIAKTPALYREHYLLPSRNNPALKACATCGLAGSGWEETQKALEWVLLATWPVNNPHEVMQCMNGYRLR